mgnify:CR=1 FL=1
MKFGRIRIGNTFEHNVVESIAISIVIRQNVDQKLGGIICVVKSMCQSPVTRRTACERSFFYVRNVSARALFLRASFLLLVLVFVLLTIKTAWVLFVVFAGYAISGIVITTIQVKQRRKKKRQAKADHES